MLKEIERAAWDLFATVGFDRATVEEISRNAGVSRRTFFRYFKTKEELLSFSVEHFGERVAQRFAEMPKSRKPLVAPVSGVVLSTERSTGCAAFMKASISLISSLESRSPSFERRQTTSSADMAHSLSMR